MVRANCKFKKFKKNHRAKSLYINELWMNEVLFLKFGRAKLPLLAQVLAIIKYQTNCAEQTQQIIQDLLNHIVSLTKFPEHGRCLRWHYGCRLPRFCRQ